MNLIWLPLTSNSIKYIIAFKPDCLSMANSQSSCRSRISLLGMEYFDAAVMS